jgi:hypothetical protein
MTGALRMTVHVGHVSAEARIFLAMTLGFRWQASPSVDSLGRLGMQIHKCYAKLLGYSKERFTMP